MIGVAKILGKNLMRIRQARQLTQAALAEQLGVSDVTVYNYERGAQFPRSEVFDGLCKALRVRPWQLLAEEGAGGTIPPELLEAIAETARLAGMKVVKGPAW